MQDRVHDLDALAAFVEGRLDELGRERVMAHAAECAECRQTMAHLSRAFGEGALGSRTPASHDVRYRLSRMRVWLPIAASIVLGTFAWFRFALPPETDGIRRSAQPSGTEEELLRTRGAGRSVAGKTFHLTSGEWIDAAYEPAAGLSVLEVRGSEERRALVERIPELAPFAALDDRVLVVWQGTVYRFEP
jgi:hypothetical protein